MNKILFHFKFILAVTILLSIGISGKCQTATDSLTLSKIISTVIQNHPSVEQAAEAINSAEAGIGLARSGYFPNIDATASYARIGPVQELTFPGFGTFQLYPADNYSANLNVYQNVYDFGRTHRNVALAKEIKNLNEQTLDQVKQKLALTTTLIYYSMVYLQQAIVINKDQLKTLEEHLEFVKKKQETGSAIQYEILSTQLKISTVESAGIDLQTSLQNQISEMNALLGQSGQITVSNELNITMPGIPTDSLLAIAYKQRDEIKLAREKTSLAELKYKLIRTQNYPTLNFQLSGGGKNGYIPNLNAVKAYFSAGLGLKVPIFEGTRTKYNLQQAKSGISSTDFETQLIKRNIAAEVEENEENITASLKKIERFTLQLNQSKEAYRLAQLNYQAGSITNLDILDASSTISESSLLLFKSRIEYIINVFKLKASLGERLY
jgi:outer membrane protein